MKRILSICMIFSCAAALNAQGLVSAFDFQGTLDKSYDRDGFAQALDFRAGGTTNATVAGGPTYSTEMVGATSKQVANFSDATAQFFRATHGMGPNGGSAQYVNQYTILMDVKITSTGDWVSLFNTNANNQNDGDLFIRDSDSALGISGTYAGLYPRSQWARLAISVDSTAGGNLMKSYVNGVLQNTNALDGLDGRWALYSTATNPKIVDILADNNGDSGSGQISLLAFYDKALSANEVANLGPVGSAVPEPATMAVVGLGLLGMIRRRRSA